jgi:hypothetical protein
VAGDQRVLVSDNNSVRATAKRAAALFSCRHDRRDWMRAVESIENPEV